MEYSSFFDEKTDIYFAIVTGKVIRPHDSIELQHKGIEAGAKNGYTRFLFDMSDAEIIIGETTDNFKVGTIPADKNRDSRHYKIALLYSGDLRDHTFMESVARNRGYNMRVFNDKSLAVTWLTST